MYRSVNKDGTMNVERQRRQNRFLSDAYHQILSMGWLHFIGTLVVAYFGINLFFACIYYSLGRQGFQGLQSADSLSFFQECFFFSVQTFSTIGYGLISPIGTVHNVIVSIQALLGLMSVGLMSGLFFSRFAKPTSKVKFSDVGLITQFNGKRCFMTRMANSRFNQIVDANVTMTLAIDQVTPEGIKFRSLHDLSLQRDRTAVFALSWTVIHWIVEGSPLYGLNAEDLKTLNAEVIVTIVGFDETFSNTVHARSSYVAEEILFDRKFIDIVERDVETHKMKVDLSRISQVSRL